MRYGVLERARNVSLIDSSIYPVDNPAAVRLYSGGGHIGGILTYSQAGPTRVHAGGGRMSELGRPSVMLQ